MVKELRESGPAGDASRVDALFIGAHPDDVEIFCGATVATLARDDRRVMIADLTRGELASNGTAEERRASSLRAARLLGTLAERPVLGLPDGALDSNDHAQVVALTSLLRRVRPQLLVSPWPHDRHPDHEAAGELVRRACFFAGVHRFAPTEGPPYRPIRLLFYPCHREVAVNVMLDVTRAMPAWREAIDAYASQFQRGPESSPTPINRPGFVNAAEARRVHGGNLLGVDFAEGFVHDGPWPVSTSSLLGEGLDH